jgi:hypothetical protein
LACGSGFASPVEHALLVLKHQLDLGLRQEAHGSGDRANVAAFRIALQRPQALGYLVTCQQFELHCDLAEQPVLRMHPAA